MLFAWTEKLTESQISSEHGPNYIMYVQMFPFDWQAEQKWHRFE